MADQATTELPAHGGTRLPSVEVDSYNLEIKDDDGDFLGDRVSKGGFREILDKLRKALSKHGDDPLGDETSEEISRAKLDKLLAEGDSEVAGLIQGAIEDYAQEFAAVIRRFLKLKSWRDTERIAVGGGFRARRVGELAIGRTGVILKAAGIDVDLMPIHHDPDEAGLIGAAHLVPAWMLKGYDAILAVDIGGTNIRAGVIELNLKRAADLSKAEVHKIELWRHADEKKMTREETVKTLVGMLEKLIGRAEKDKVALTPFIGIGCPGIIERDGSIDRGAQNLPGNWESSTFNLPARLFEAIPKIGDHRTTILMHNDAVVQGLSEVPYMQDVTHWGALTIGTGLGNARFTNRHDDE
jgi:ROK family protein